MKSPQTHPRTWEEFGFEVEITGDQSPSLRLLQPTHELVPKGESMHHSGGAAAETELIYGQVIRRCFQQILAPHFLSVGLGLGYVEMCVARESLFKQNFNFTLESYESVPELKSLLKSWIFGEEMPGAIQSVYDLVLQFVLQESPFSAAELKSLLARKLQENQWVLRGSLDEFYTVGTPAQTLLFDAFSSKTNPELWDEEFLTKFFSETTDKDCLVSTYACKGSLKRALKRAGFEVEVRAGFQGKRNSTLGSKGIFISSQS